MDGDAVIIEVGANEAATAEANPHVPVAPAACAQDAVRCVDAGASMYHWHARDPDTGAQRLGDARLYGQALDQMRTTEVLGYPSYPIDVPEEGRLDHVWVLGDQHGLELAPIDIGSVSIVLWDPVVNDFVAPDALRGHGVIDNSLPFVLDGLAAAGQRGMVATLGAFDVGFTRTMVLLARSGRLRTPFVHKIFLWGAPAIGPEPDEGALDAHLAQVPDDLDLEWLVVPYGLGDPALVERLCRHALRRGGGVRIGIGDCPTAFPEATNAELVERAAGWADQEGRPVASAADVRERLAIAPVPPAAPQASA